MGKLLKGGDNNVVIRLAVVSPQSVLSQYERIIESFLWCTISVYSSVIDLITRIRNEGQLTLMAVRKASL